MLIYEKSLNQISLSLTRLKKKNVSKKSHIPYIFIIQAFTQRQSCDLPALLRTRQKAALLSAIRKSRSMPRICKNLATSWMRSAT